MSPRPVYKALKPDLHNHINPDIHPHFQSRITIYTTNFLTNIELSLSINTFDHVDLISSSTSGPSQRSCAPDSLLKTVPKHQIYLSIHQLQCREPRPPLQRPSPHHGLQPTLPRRPRSHRLNRKPHLPPTPLRRQQRPRHRGNELRRLRRRRRQLLR